MSWHVATMDSAHHCLKLFHSVPAQRAYTRKSLGFDIRSLFLLLSFAPDNFHGCAPITLVRVCSESLSDRKVGTQIDYETSLPILLRKQGRWLFRQMRAIRTQTQSFTIRGEIHAHPTPAVASNATEYFSGLLVIFPLKGLIRNHPERQPTFW